ncbi:hypothetical protein BV508_16460 [Mycobacterium intermedium]|nr:hypothetical protein BV508_16460 [Mycobacterium intermedium]
MLVSPLLAAAALTQTVGSALYYPYIAMLFVEADSATLAVVDVADGSIVDLHRQPLGRAERDRRAELVAMVAELQAPASRAKGLFVVGCGVDIVPLKSALEAATSLAVSFPAEPHLALARGAALASANAPLFASSTAALAYALDPGTGEVNSQALTPTYLDVCANAHLGDQALAYSAWSDDTDGVDDPVGVRAKKSRRLALAGSAMAGVTATAAGALMISLTSDVRPAALSEPSPRQTPPASVALPANPPASPAASIPAPPSQLPAPATAEPPPAQLPAPSPKPAPVTVAAPPTVLQQPTVVQKAPPTVANAVPAPRRQPTRQVPPPVQTPVPEAAPPSAPAAPPAPPEPAAPAAPPTPVMTMYLHVPFVTIPIPIYPPAPPPPPPAPPEAEP